MAVASGIGVRFAHGLSGFLSSPGDADRFQKDVTPRFALGSGMKDAVGNTYRYSHFGADTNRGVLCAQDFSESGVPDSDNVIVAPASAVTTSDGTIGSRFIEITSASITANEYAGGQFITTDDTGEGYTYNIKGNSATGNPASGTWRLELWEPLQVAVTSDTDFTIVGNRFANLEILTAATDCVIAGVTCSTMDVSEQAYGWVQTTGIVGILQDGTIALGDVVVTSTAVSGAVMVLGGGDTDQITEYSTEAIVGYCVDPGDNTGHGAFYINLE